MTDDPAMMMHMESEMVMRADETEFEDCMCIIIAASAAIGRR